MTVDLSEFRTQTPRRCITSVSINKLSDEDRVKVLAAIQEPTITHIAIVSWLRARGIQIGKESLRLHRLGECACA